MMATVPHVTSGSGLRKFQADEFLFDRVYIVLISNLYPVLLLSHLVTDQTSTMGFHVIF